MLNDQQFEELLADYFEGDASEQSIKALHDAIRQSAQRRERFQEETRLHVLLSENCKEEMELELIRKSVGEEGQQRKTSYVTWVSVAAAVLLAFSTSALYLRLPKEGSSRDVVGHCVNLTGSNDLQILRDNVWVTLRPDEALRLGDRVKCGENAQAMLRLSEGSLLSMEPRSEVTFSSNQSEIRLERGKVLFEVAKRDSQAPPFRVHTLRSTVDVLGTVFELVESDDTKLEVYEGRVTLTRHRDNATVEVSAQQMVTTGAALLKPKALDSPSLDTISLLPSDDVTLDRGRPESQGTRLKVEGKRRVAYLRFEIPDVRGIQSARLRLTQDVDAGSGTLRFFLGNHAEWTEADLNERSAPSKGREVARHRGVVGRGQVVEVDVSDAIAKAGPMAFVVTLDKDLENDIWFSSREGKHPPELLLTLRPEQQL